MKILKFGGTSVGTTESISSVIGIVLSEVKAGNKIAVVCSAMGGVTNQLIEMSNLAAQGNQQYAEILKSVEERHFNTLKSLTDVKNQSKCLVNVQLLFNDLADILQGVFLIRELSKRTLDLVMSFGERLSSYMVSEAIKQVSGKQCEYLDARTLIRTDRNFGNAHVDFKTTNANIEEYFAKHKSIQVITGFIGSTANNETTTLGRGGSDYTAAIIGAALNCEEIQIWTDVDGIMTADPRSVKKAFSLAFMTYTEAMELSHFGAKVIFPPTIQPAFAKNIPLRIKNTFNPGFPGTIVSEKSERGDFLIKGISSISDIALINIQGSGMIGVPGVAGRLFTVLAKNHISIILITQASSEHSICFVIDPKEAKKAKTVIEDEFRREIDDGKIDEVKIESELSVVAIVGKNMKQTPGITGKMFNALGKNGINVVAIAQGSSEFNISVVVNRHNLSKGLNALHEAFFLSDTKSLNIFLVGVGLIGGTLLKQIMAQSKYLLEKRSIKINIVGMGNSKKMLFDEDGINHEGTEGMEGIRKLLDEKGKPMNLDFFINTMKEMNLSNSIFVDCTSARELVKYYDEVLHSSISIVTPNKIANSGAYCDYEQLMKHASRRGVKFLYETNVGAGLPVISTLKDLIVSGDRIIKIEAILSGTLSFIFNTYKAGTNFSDVVKQAKEKGYTEPDPRDDLSGMDVARKILILARETGLELEMKDVKIENILPESCIRAKTVDDFFTALEKENAFFEKKRSNAEKEGKVLRFIASLDNGNTRLGLQAVDASHPFYSLSGSDNIISFTTERYKERPLVVKGPGAGSEVTAAGVFAEIISISGD